MGGAGGGGAPHHFLFLMRVSTAPATDYRLLATDDKLGCGENMVCALWEPPAEEMDEIGGKTALSNHESESE